GPDDHAAVALLLRERALGEDRRLVLVRDVLRGRAAVRVGDRRREREIRLLRGGVDFFRRRGGGVERAARGEERGERIRVVAADDVGARRRRLPRPGDAAGVADGVEREAHAELRLGDAGGGVALERVVDGDRRRAGDAGQRR